jgi:hypothetical protein
VADAVAAIDRMLAQDFFEVVQLSGSAAKLKRGRGKRGSGRTAHGDSGRIVTPVFETPKPLDDDWNYLLWANVTDDAAHAKILFEPAGGGM